MPLTPAIAQRILIVCRGNTCRSPMAEAIARDLLGSETVVLSAGLDTHDGGYATKDAIAVMRGRNLDLSGHRSRPVESLDVHGFDVVIAMDRDVAQKLGDLGVDSAKIVTLEIPDPYGKGIDVYRDTARAIERDLRRLFGKEEPA